MMTESERKERIDLNEMVNVLGPELERERERERKWLRKGRNRS